MATTTDSQPQVRMIALDQIRHDANVRELAGEDVDALAGSITPAIVRPDGDGYVLYLQQPVIRSMGDPRWSSPSVRAGTAAGTSHNPAAGVWASCAMPRIRS
jgi:hypothetical protein